MATPITSGNNTVSRSGFPIAQLLNVSPGISNGAINGIRTTVLTTASGMMAAARDMSARAFLMNSGKAGAVGARLKMSNPVA